jgi:two-component system NtrC family sensor kinase
LRLRSLIFWWVILTAVLPVTALVWTAIAYSESEFRGGAERALQEQIGALNAEFSRWHAFRSDLTLGLASVPAVRDFVDQLAAYAGSATNAPLNNSAERLQLFLEAFQDTVPDVDLIRLLDVQGNTLIKVRSARRIRAELESLTPLKLVEHEIDDPAFRDTLAQLRGGETGHLLLPHNAVEGFARVPLLDAVTPLFSDGERVGYLAVTVFGHPLDRIAESARRSYGESISVFELNPDDPARDGLLLYRDAPRLRFANWLAPPLRPDSRAQPVLAKVAAQPFGKFQDSSAETTTLYAEYHPYPDRLISWAVAIEVADAQISAPFLRMQRVVLAVATVLALVGLALAGFGARRITRPLQSLTNGLQQFAEGNAETRLRPEGAIEFQQVAESFNDMGERITRAEAQRQQAQERLLESAKLASMGRMAAGIAHEINNPLNNILAFAKLVQRDLPEHQTQVREDITAIQSEALRASEIVQGMLGFAREAPARFAQFDSQQWFEESIKLVRAEATNAGVEVSGRVASAGDVVGDRAQLQQCAINLLRNAIQASSLHQEVLATLTVDDDGMTVTVIDQGSGISEEDLKQAFEPFFSTKEVGQGAGLGLSVSLGLIQRHGGQLWLKKRTDGAGTIASMWVPRQLQNIPVATDTSVI